MEVCYLNKANNSKDQNSKLWLSPYQFCLAYNKLNLI